MDEAQRAALFANPARALGDAPELVKQRHMEHCRRADPDYAAGGAAALAELAIRSPDIAPYP